jgi:hypothetical protein
VVRARLRKQNTASFRQPVASGTGETEETEQFFYNLRRPSVRARLRKPNTASLRQPVASGTGETEAAEQCWFETASGTGETEETEHR